MKLPADEASQLITAQIQEAHTQLTSIQSLKRDLLTTNGQDANQYDLDELGQPSTFTIKRELERWQQRPAIPTDKSRQERVFVAEENYKNCRANTEYLLRYELFDTEQVYEEFVFSFGFFGYLGYTLTAQERLEDLGKKLLEDIRRLTLIRKRVRAAYYRVEVWPCERIPDHNWDRKAVRLWRGGSTYREIATRLDKKISTVGNRIRWLRQEYGEDIVPKKRGLRELRNR